MRHERGYTLIELAVVLAIVALVAAITLGGLSGLRQRAAAGNFVGELGMEIANARLLAAQRSRPVVIVLHFDPATEDRRNGYMVYVEGDTPIDIHNLDTFPIDFDDHPGLQLMGSTNIGAGRLEPVEWDKLGLTTSYPFSSLIANVVRWPPEDGVSCSFCKLYDGATRGAIRITPDGRIFLSRTGAGREPDEQGGGLVVATAAGERNRIHVLAVLAPSGMFRIFSR